MYSPVSLRAESGPRRKERQEGDFTPRDGRCVPITGSLYRRCLVREALVVRPGKKTLPTQKWGKEQAIQKTNRSAACPKKREKAPKTGRVGGKKRADRQGSFITARDLRPEDFAPFFGQDAGKAP